MVLNRNLGLHDSYTWCYILIVLQWTVYENRNERVIITLNTNIFQTEWYAALHTSVPLMFNCCTDKTSWCKVTTLLTESVITFPCILLNIIILKKSNKIFKSYWNTDCIPHAFRPQVLLEAPVSNLIEISLVVLEMKFSDEWAHLHFAFFFV
jgi:hypothetical protein